MCDDDLPSIYEWHASVVELPFACPDDRRLYSWEDFHRAAARFVTAAITVTIWQPPQTRIGFIRCGEMSYADRWFRFNFYVHDLASRRRSALEALALFSDYLIVTMNARKLYCVIPEFDSEACGLASEVVYELEGADRQHYRIAGRNWDRLHFALYSARWREVRQDLVARAEIELAVSDALRERAVVEP